MTIIELKLEVINLLKSVPSVKVEWKPRKHVYQIRWKKTTIYSSGEEIFQFLKELHKSSTGKTYDFSFLSYGIYEKHIEIFV